jgi:uncharacterized protein YutE (UPF0331/DUF86 family)
MPIALDDVCFNKAAIIERCLVRVFEEARLDPSLSNWSHIDALVMNLERACQAAIDLAMHLVSRDRLGLPQSSAEAFVLLNQKGLVTEEITKALAAMVGFRNVAVHSYQSLNLLVVRSIVEKDWRVFVEFARELGLRVDPRTEGLDE